ncbi:class I SAM-dependent methyltransferase [Trinickia fusca]|uniref:Class I SAM-dependent methyltransferase n=1 Tax=Trinickia fusca TaxID=2419777 RepID=A0A494XXH5_9BURK|nr:class I SAM-dependent methyltransferase [Trinickia fusca]RKP52804.1 class I SAM-dependent methyltransferase [Trinickia fusca]
MQPHEIVQQMRKTYDRYFMSSLYRQRYPRPNEATLDFVLRSRVREIEHVLDFGCGNGRYAFPLLQRSHDCVTAYDISALSLAEFESRLRDTPYRSRVRFVHDDLDTLARLGQYDVILMLFGVLSHLGDRATRIDMLKRLRGMMRADGRLVLSVPSRLRRYPGVLLRHALARCLRTAHAPLDEAGNIFYTRSANGDRMTFFYHLYTLDELRAELATAGFAVRRSEAESVLPERWVTQSSFVGQLDRCLAACLMPSLGYGMRVLATPI